MCSRQPNSSFVAVLETGVSETNSDSLTLELHTITSVTD